MSNEQLGLALIVGALIIGAVIAYLLVHIYEIDWFRVRLLSQDRWTRALGMLPIIVPLYVLVAVVFSALKNSE